MKDLQYILAPGLIKKILSRETDEFNEISICQAELLLSLYKKIKLAPDRAAEKQIIGDWLGQSFSPEQIAPNELYSSFREAIRKARDFRESLIREFVPDTLRFPFTSDGMVSVTNDPTQLLKTIFAPPGDPFYNDIRSFEALVIWSLGNRYLLMKVNNEKWRTDEHLRRITLLLEDTLFNPGEGIRPRKEILRVFYNPMDAYRFASFILQETLPVIEYQVFYRLIRTENREVPVLYDGREKKDEDAFRKTLLLSKGEMPIVFDQRAISLTFMSKEALLAVRKILFEKLICNGVMISDWKINGHGGKKVNQKSSEKYAADEQFKVYLNGGLLEVQLFTFGNYFNQKLSLGEENHKFYRLGQLLDLLPLIFPASLYIDWEDPKIKKKLYDLQKARLMSNFAD
jgi:hypothetical protein